MSAERPLADVRLALDARELREVLRDVQGQLRAAMLMVETALAEPEDDAVVSGDMGCTHPQDARVSVAAMGDGGAFICKTCGAEVEA